MIQFENPGFFAVLALAIPFIIYWHRHSYADLAPRRALISMFVRIAGIALLVSALAKPVLMLENSDRSILFLIDVSDSIRPDAITEAWQFIEKETQALEGEQQAGLLLFGREPRLVLPPTNAAFELTPELRRKLMHKGEEDRIRTRIQEIERSALGDAEKTELAELRGHLSEIEAWRTEIGSDETNIEAACRLARGLLPEETRRRVVLMSDGNSNRGDVLRELEELRDARFSVHTRLMQHGTEPEVIAEELFLPAEAQVKAAFSLEVAINSNVETTASVKIYRNKFLVASQDVELSIGRNLTELPKIRLDEGFHEFEAVVQPKIDTVLQNNVARGAVRVTGRPKVLLVERNEDEARYLEEALASEEIEVEVRPEAGVPQDLGDLLNYDVVILSDIGADNFGPGQMEAMKTYVRTYGGGLIMLGGEHSFGLGGYYRTPIEDALPVKMPIKKNVEKPNLSLVLVIDKSGSMSGNKIELAKEAAIAAAEVLKRNDRFGVVAFDGRSEWICSMTDSSDLNSITSTIARLVAGGGTNIYPGLYDAYQALLDEDAKLKHIILLSDGQTQGTGYDTLVGHIASDGITLSTVGIGDGADRQLLGDMASWGGGETYFTNDFGSIPQIFTRETMRASKSMLIEEPFVPTQTAASSILKGIDAQSLPFLLGYVATQPKETAAVALVSDYGDPILASWNYGLGRSVAFTSDAKSNWAGDWIGWDSFSKFWSQLVRSVMSTGAHKELNTRTRVDVRNGIAHITIDVRDRRGSYRDDITTELGLMTRDDQEPIPLEVEHVGPGLLRAEFPIEEYGEFYRLLMIQKQGAETVGIRALGITESYSPEFRTAAPDKDTLELIAEETGGNFDPTTEQLWKFEGDPARTPKDTWWWWLIAAAILLPFDIAGRRLGG